MAKQNRIKKEFKTELIGITIIAISLFMAFCIWRGTGEDEINNIGAIGSFIYRAVTTFFGSGKVLFPFILFLVGISKLWLRNEWDKITLISWIVFYSFILAMIHINLSDSSQTFKLAWQGAGGGIVGYLLGSITLTLFGKIGSYIFIIATMLVALTGIVNTPIGQIIKKQTGNLAHILTRIRKELTDYIFQNKQEEKKEDDEENTNDMQNNEKPIIPLIINNNEEKQNDDIAINTSPALIRNNLKLIRNESSLEKKNKSSTINNEILDASYKLHGTEYKKPSLNILQLPNKIKSQRLNKDITENVKTLEATLENFGVNARVTQVNKGPSITRYEIQPPPGIKVSRIVNLADDIALSLAATQVRIEAPIPGKAAVGIEVPNDKISMVSLREILETGLFQDSDSKLTVALGKDIAGKPIVADLAKMPHLLIAGATGSGKSVCMNAIIASILFKAHPDEVKLLMVDPKVVELSSFNGIPHLISPVVTDSKKAASALRWIVHEMENRYELFAGAGVKDLDRYNQVKNEENPEDKNAYLPQIVVLIDELADLMMVAPADVEDAICRIAQMARAAGIHLVIATQRPSVDVITGVIKANIPSRIAFAVSSQIDSRTILDMGGAEKLLGRGDMLFYPTGMAKPIRVQGVYVSDPEMEKLVEFLKKQKNPQYITPWQNTEKEIKETNEEDELLPEAAKIFIESGQASISLLQRRLRIGYTRAARIIDQLEDKGIVGGYEGSKPRVVRMSWDEYEKTYGTEAN